VSVVHWLSIYEKVLPFLRCAFVTMKKRKGEYCTRFNRHLY